MLTGVATGVSSDAAAATQTDISTGRTSTPISVAAAAPIGITISAVAMLLISWPKTAVTTNSPTSSPYGPSPPTDADQGIGHLVRGTALRSSRSTAGASPATSTTVVQVIAR